MSTSPPLESLQTEQRNPRTSDLDTMAPLDLVTALHAESFLAAEAVQEALPEIARAVEAIAARLKGGGRLFYVGAGTSGRIGVLDASECPPTFGVEPDLVQGIIAGGDHALRYSVEGAEDDPERGAADIRAHGLTSRDAVVGIAASGRTPYTIGALRAARESGALTISVANVRPSLLEQEADIAIAAVTGPEALTGSTRLKAGSAQKMTLNLLSTGSMALLGKLYGNLMVDVRATNEKLRDRAIRIVSDAAETDRETALAALKSCDWHAKTAIVMIRCSVDAEEARERLRRAEGYVRRALHTE